MFSGFVPAQNANFVKIFCIGFTFKCWLRTFRPSQLLLYDSPRSLYMLIQVGTLQREVVRLSRFLVRLFLSPTMPISIVASTSLTNVLVWWLGSPRRRQYGEKSCESRLLTAPGCNQLHYEKSMCHSQTDLGTWAVFACLLYINWILSCEFCIRGANGSA